MYLVREYTNKNRWEILGSNGWKKIPEQTMADFHEDMGYEGNKNYYTFYRVKDNDGGYTWDCSAEVEAMLDMRRVGKKRKIEVMCPRCMVVVDIAPVDETKCPSCGLLFITVEKT